MPGDNESLRMAVEFLYRELMHMGPCMALASMGDYARMELGLPSVGSALGFASTVCNFRPNGTGPKSDNTRIFAKGAKQSGKARATDLPSWVRAEGHRPYDTESAQAFAMRILDDKYGVGNWGRGGGTEFSKIVKWVERSLRQ